MYRHHIQNMASSLVEAGLVQDSQAAENVLSQYWLGKVAVVSTIDDVHAIQNDFDEDEETSSLSNEEADKILQKAFDEHNGNEGISKENLRYWSQKVALEAGTNDYDEFESEMLAAGWSLEKIEAAWQKALREEENISRSSAICHDDYDPSWKE